VIAGTIIDLVSTVGRAVLEPHARPPYATEPPCRQASDVPLRAYAHDQGLSDLARDNVARRLLLCPGLGPRWDGQA
jgi:hypothetical protein